MTLLAALCCAFAFFAIGFVAGAEVGDDLTEWWTERAERRRLDQWRRMGVPDDVRERAEKAGVRRAPDWYAGRREEQ